MLTLPSGPNGLKPGFTTSSNFMSLNNVICMQLFKRKEKGLKGLEKNSKPFGPLGKLFHFLLSATVNGLI